MTTELEQWEETLKRYSAKGATPEEHSELLRRATSWRYCAVGSCMQNIIGDDWKRICNIKLGRFVSNASTAIHANGYRFTDCIQKGKYGEALICLEDIKKEAADLDQKSIDYLRIATNDANKRRCTICGNNPNSD